MDRAALLLGRVLLAAAALAVVAGCSSNPKVLPLGMSAAGARPRTTMPLWSLIESPNVPPGTDGLYDDLLRGVGGTGPNDVWAVGNDCCYASGTQEYTHSLIEHWDGSKWKIVPYPKEEPADSQLFAVGAIATDDVWAVGNAPYPNNQALIEHWDGKKWSVVSNPYVANNAELLSITAISRDNVWAAGEGNYAALLEHWNGKEWSFVPGLTMGGLTILSSIAAAGPNDIMAIGSYYSYGSPLLFAEHWNGRTWSDAQPANDFYAASFNAVAAAGKNDYWGVGYEETGQHSLAPQTLTEHWSGSTWAAVASPNKDPKSGYSLTNILSGVAASSSQDVWAVGVWTYYPGSGTTRSLFERWNGKAWKVQAGPPSLESGDNQASNELLGIARLAPHVLWAVGNRVIPPNCCDETSTVETTHG